MEIKQENIIAAYNTADDYGKRIIAARNRIIAALLGEEAVQADTTSDKRPVTDRIKTNANVNGKSRLDKGIQVNNRR